MKAQAFLELTGLTFTAQADYYAVSKKFGSKSKEAIVALIKAKGLENQCRAVIAEGRLEPDEPTATVVVHTTEAYQRQFALTEQPAEYVTTKVSAEEQRQLRLHLEDERDAGEIERESDDGEGE